MSDFIQTAIDSAKKYLESVPTLKHTWGESDSGAPSLTIDAVGESGFPVELVFEEYGIYPYAGDWHGAPWDASVWSGERLVQTIREFLQSVYSSEGYLDVFYSGNRPYRLILHHSFEGQWVNDETALIFFNWFGRRSRRTLRNVAAGAIEGIE